MLKNAAKAAPGATPDIALATQSLARPSGAVRLGKQAAMVAILAMAYFLTAAVAAHLVDTQYNFFSDYISDYAVGSWGWAGGAGGVRYAATPTAESSAAATRLRPRRLA